MFCSDAMLIPWASMATPVRRSLRLKDAEGIQIRRPLCIHDGAAFEEAGRDELQGLQGSRRDEDRRRRGDDADFFQMARHGFAQALQPQRLRIARDSIDDAARDNASFIMSAGKRRGSSSPVPRRTICGENSNRLISCTTVLLAWK